MLPNVNQDPATAPAEARRLKALGALTRRGRASLEALETAGWALFDLAETASGWKGTIAHHERGIMLIERSADLAVDARVRCATTSAGSR